MPIRPSSPSLATISYGKRFSRSSSSATGRTSPSAKSRTRRRICCCSSVTSNCMRRGMLLPASPRLAELGGTPEADEVALELVARRDLPEDPAHEPPARRTARGELHRVGRIHLASRREAELARAAAEGRPGRDRRSREGADERSPRDAESELRRLAAAA